MPTKREVIQDPNSCFNQAADDEPIFVLRAKDVLAAGAVRWWARTAETMGLHRDKISDAFRIANEMDVWREENKPK